MNKEFEKLKEKFGTTNLTTANSKKALRVAHMEADIREFAGKASFSLDLATLEEAELKLGPHGHSVGTYILEWNTKEIPTKLSLKNKIAQKSKKLSECPDYLQDYMAQKIHTFAKAFQKYLNTDQEKVINALYDQEEEKAHLDKDDLS